MEYTKVYIKSKINESDLDVGKTWLVMLEGTTKDAKLHSTLHKECTTKEKAEEEANKLVNEWNITFYQD